ncbi:MAG TPA: GNAT family N-acetyltransferase [Gaiellaceae bacterium]|nr:GNAT family N-acetyltransferase [Gaiellaceae bacterium]
MSETFTVRPARMEEVDAAARLLNEHSRLLHGVDDESASQLLQYWESPDRDFERDVLLAESVDGSLLGYAALGVHGEHVWLDVRGLEAEHLRTLLEAIELRASEKKPGAGLLGYTSEADHVVRGAFEQSGYRVIRHGYRMEISLDGGAPEPEWPEGFTVRTMRTGEEERVYEAQMASFADTWMFAHEPFDVWSHWYLKDPGFDPSLWFLAEAGDELAGIAITRESENEPGLGWVCILGVLPRFRQRGLATALLRQTFSECASRGLERVGLGVDAENPAGAVRVYERAGMHVARTNLILEKVQG